MDNNYFGITDTGKLRSNNEDTFIAEKIAGTDFVIACVIDGVGGYTGGEVAAAIARQAILSLLDDPDGDLSLLMQAAIAEANDQIIAKKQQNREYEDMACVLTLALVDLNNNQFYYAHVGDTRLYLLRDQSLIKISKDQSFVGFMEDSGRLTEEQAMSHPKRNEINKALGFAGNIGVQEDYIETGNSPFLPGDLILICSDGLSDMVNKQEITNILLADSNLQQKSIALVEAANHNGGRDNITAVLVKNDKKTLAHEATKPVVRNRKKKLVAPAQEPVASGVADNPPPLLSDAITVVEKKAKRSNLLWLILIVVMLACMALFLWKYFSTTPTTDKNTVTAPALLTPKTAAERLQDTLNKLKGNILILDDSTFTSPIIISKPLSITRDSLYLKAKRNLVIKSDSNYKGQPFFIATANKSTLLENFTLENFKDITVLQKKGVLLKDVQFIRTDSLTGKSKP